MGGIRNRWNVFEILRLIGINNMLGYGWDGGVLNVNDGGNGMEGNELLGWRMKKRKGGGEKKRIIFWGKSLEFKWVINFRGWVKGEVIL